MGSLANCEALEIDVLVDRVQATYDRINALTADFEQVATLSSINRRQVSSGRLYIEKPNWIRWQYDKPEQQTILYDGAVLQIYTPRRQQLLRSAVDDNDRSNVAFLFLAGVVKLREVFVITALQETEAGHSLIRLLPRSPLAGFAELRAAVNQQSYLIEGLWILDPIGNLTEIRLSSLDLHTDLPASTFELEIPPDAEILSPADFANPQ
ncbi:MAG: outer membrane lipoprotein carrier protein LolA [Candidatus Tectomicrobia bacterium]|nr:outer membrane lipoprotein carrier protein LolA [Candidatus Tectomicrobia bacterium]